MAPGAARVNSSYHSWHSSSHVGIKPLMYFFAADRIAKHRSVFGSGVGLGSLLAAVLSLSVKFAQPAFRMFHVLT